MHDSKRYCYLITDNTNSLGEALRAKTNLWCQAKDSIVRIINDDIEKTTTSTSSNKRKDNTPTTTTATTKTS